MDLQAELVAGEEWSSVFNFDRQLVELIHYVKSVGKIYGMEDFSVFLYSIVLMHKPKLVVELGSGSGSASLMCAKALKENGIGKVISIDNGSQWDRILLRMQSIGFQTDCGYNQFLKNLAERFGLAEYVDYEVGIFPPFPQSSQTIDLLFADYESGHFAVAEILSYYLPKMADASSIFIDGASTSWTSFHFMEKMVNDLGAGKISDTFLRLMAQEEISKFEQLVRRRKFTLVHLTRQRDTQNSTCWLKIEPIDNRPHPITKMR